MKTKIPKKTRRIVACYLAALIILYVVIYVVPKVTDLFETTQVLENGTLIVSCETEGYIVKDETISLAPETGTIRYKVGQGTVIKKGTDIVDFESEEEEVEGEEKSIHGKYEDALAKLDGYRGVKESTESQVSGVLSFTMDGNEKYFATSNIDKITRQGAQELSYGTIELERDDVIKGEPMFKVSSDDNWYIVSWLSEGDAKAYEEGTEVRLELPDGKINATVHSMKKDDGDVKVVFYTNSYYKSFAETRDVSMNIVKSNNTGLIVDNECIIEVDGVKGVFVVDKDGDYSFKPINITATDGKQSVLSEKTFTNDKYELVETVIVHDEVLRNPERALEKEDN